jgi:arsenate reductase
VKAVLFLCTHNSARSQMAEAFLNNLRGDKYNAENAGITPTEVNPNVIKVMAEVGIDLSNNRSKSIEEFRGHEFDYVVTVCDHTKETCPFFPGETLLHKNFTDPSTLKGNTETVLKKYEQ